MRQEPTPAFRASNAMYGVIYDALIRYVYTTTLESAIIQHLYERNLRKGGIGKAAIMLAINPGAPVTAPNVRKCLSLGRRINFLSV